MSFYENIVYDLVFKNGNMILEKLNEKEKYLLDDDNFILRLIELNSGNGWADLDIGLHGIKLKNKIESDSVIKYASARIKNCRKIVGKEVSYHIEFLKYASEELRDDEDFVSQFINVNPNILEFASERIKNDKKIITKALNVYGKNFNTNIIGDKLKKDYDFLAENKCYNLLSDQINGNYNLIKQIMLRNKNYYDASLISDSLTTDKDFILQLIKRSYGDILLHIDKELFHDKDFLEKAISISAWSFTYIPKNYLDEIDILNIVKKNTKSRIIWNHIKREFIDNRNLICKCLEIFDKVFDISDEDNNIFNRRYSDDKEIMMKLARNSCDCLLIASEKLRDDKEFVLTAFQNYDIIVYYTWNPYPHFEDESAGTKHLYNPLDLISERLQKDKDILKLVREKMII